MTEEKYKKAELLFEKCIYHSEYATNERIRKEAEKWFNELSNLENEMSKPR
tara:strand:- start:1754 stop:1906 length:153 start_codon:yes stop_codon:yes gene_type:complete